MGTVSSLIAYKNRNGKIYFDNYVFEDLPPMTASETQQVIDGRAKIEWSCAKNLSPENFAEKTVFHLIRVAFSLADKEHQIEHIRNALRFIDSYFNCSHTVICAYGREFMNNGVLRKADLNYILKWQEEIIQHRLFSTDESILLEGLSELLAV